MGVPLNKVPPGLLDFFGIKSGEWGPRELGQQLVPTLDLARWYLDPYALEVSVLVTANPFLATLGGLALGLTSTSPVDLVVAGTISVPQTEVWLLLEADVWWALSGNAGNSGSFSWSVGALVPPGTTQGFVDSVAGAARWGSWSLDHPFWCLPGSVISLNANGLVIAAGSIQIGAGVPSLPRLRIARFKA